MVWSSIRNIIFNIFVKEKENWGELGGELGSDHAI